MNAVLINIFYREIAPQIECRESFIRYRARHKYAPHATRYAPQITE